MFQNLRRFFVERTEQQTPDSSNHSIQVDSLLRIRKGLFSIPGYRSLITPALLVMCLTCVIGCGGLKYNNLGTSTGSTQTNSSVLSEVNCGTQSLTGAQTRSCAVALNSAALSQITVVLTTNNPVLKVPSSVTIGTGQSSASFDAATAGVSQAAAVTISASYHGVTKSTALTLYPTGTGSGSPVSSHKVQLNWSAPSGTNGGIAGYNVYRSTTGVSSYALLNPTIDAVTSYLDTDVQSGSTYSYIVKTVDDKGLESSPSNSTQITIP